MTRMNEETLAMTSNTLLSVRHLRVEIPTRHGPLLALDDAKAAARCKRP